MKAEIITVGTELLLGQIVNTNTAYLSQELANLGFDVYYQVTVGDNRLRLLSALELAEKRSDVVLVCGGLGPTVDDLTKETVAEHVGQPLVYDPLALERLEDFFKFRKEAVTENNKQQALSIKGAYTIQNPTGLACGTMVEKEDTYYLLLPGPPSELKSMYETHVKELLQEILPQTKRLYSRYLRYLGIGESRLVTELDDLIEQQTNPTIAPYAKSNEVMLRLTAQSETKEEAMILLDNMEQTISKRVGQYFYAYGEHTTIVDVVIEELLKTNQSIGFVEMLTNGEASNRFFDAKNGDKVCVGALVSENLSVMEQLLNTDLPQSLSYEQVEKLVVAGKNNLQSDVCVSFVGQTGEDEEGVPHGTIYIGIATSNKVEVKELLIRREKPYMKDGAIKHGLNHVYQLLK